MPGLRRWCLNETVRDDMYCTKSMDCGLDRWDILVCSFSWKAREREFLGFAVLVECVCGLWVF